jgi:hypothetical protein
MESKKDFQDIQQSKDLNRPPPLDIADTIKLKNLSQQVHNERRNGNNKNLINKENSTSQSNHQTIHKLKGRFRKENPNMMTVWPEGSIRDETPKARKKQRENRLEQKKSDDEKIEKIHRHKRYESMEFFLFLLGSCLLWYLLVCYILKHQKFPIHKHKLEVAGMIIIPIILTLFMLIAMDWGFKR